MLLYHPLGLGDHIVCNGIVREYATHYEKLGLFCFQQYKASVAHMYTDLPNVHIEAIRSQREIPWFRLTHFLQGVRYDMQKTIGVIDPESGVQYQHQIYRSAGVPIEKLWDNFLIPRNTEQENRLFTALVPNAEPYQFIHDDSRFPMDTHRLSATLTPIRPRKELTDNIGDYCALIEKASEVHVIDSSFMFLVDCLPYHNPNQKLFVHRYTRPNTAWTLPILKKQWTILD